MAAGSSGTRAILAASMGNLLEWYDFSVYALFAIYIGENFFPSGNSAAALIKAFLVFGLGFVIRPLGAAVMGIYGDRAGRKAALTATILVMAGGTLIIAASPSFAAIGVGAPLLLLAGRIMQGFSAGGEIGSAAAFLVEHAPAGRRGCSRPGCRRAWACRTSWARWWRSRSPRCCRSRAVIRWGWRVPFLIGLGIVPLGLYLRRTLEETPAFRAERARRRAPLPLARVFREHPGALLAGFGISILWAVAVYVLLIFMPVFVQKAFGFSAAQAFGSSLVENVCFVGGCFGFGALADRIGHSRMQAIGAAPLRSRCCRCLCGSTGPARCRCSSWCSRLRDHGRELYERRADDRLRPVPHPGSGNRGVARL